jgi:hypothetical protein
LCLILGWCYENWGFQKSSSQIGSAAKSCPLLVKRINLFYLKMSPSTLKGNNIEETSLNGLRKSSFTDFLAPHQYQVFSKSCLLTSWDANCWFSNFQGTPEYKSKMRREKLSTITCVTLAIFFMLYNSVEEIADIPSRMQLGEPGFSTSFLKWDN